MPHHTGNIHERFLRHIWSQQYLKQSELRTADGKPVEVLSVGAINLDGGPDFHNAKIKIGKTTYAGDVEIHRTAFEWLQHHHEQDPRYNKVILHVVLEGDTEKSPTIVHSGRSVPVLVLEPFLSESIRSIWQKTILDERVRRSEAIKCSRVNGGIPAELLRKWLNHLSVERLELKLRRFDERLKQLAHTGRMEVREEFRKYGLREEGFPDEIPPPMPELTQQDFSKRELWEQILYEGIMEGLGYSKNQEPFVRLAQNVSLAWVRSADADAPTLEAVLFGAAGLLPKISALKDNHSKAYARGLIDAWHGIRDRYRSEVLHPADWQFFPTRPANFPTVRLSAVPALIQKFLKDDVFWKIIQTIKSIVSANEKQIALHKLLHIDAHPFWSRHYNFDEPSAKPIKPLGASRIDDMIVNTILPIALLYARIFIDKDVREGAVSFLNAMAPLSENSVTRLMSKQLLKGKVKLDSAGAQQGVIQLYKFYCTEERCAECEVGKRVF
ncbi:MAG: DUF2851 family protein [Ignavibacteriae bacterium]|nr:DUF2851 family protein [Ignavibacteriota bacterium]